MLTTTLSATSTPGVSLAVALPDFQTFDDITLNLAGQLVAAATSEEEVENWEFFNDRHLRDNLEGWTGPMGDDGPDGDRTFITELERSFVSNNVAREIVVRHVDGLLFREPAWGAALERALKEDEEPTEDEAKAIARKDALLLAWSRSSLRCTYTDRKGRLKTCDVHSLLARAAKMFVATGRAVLRIFIPPGERDATGALPFVSLEDALDRIHIELCEPGIATVHVQRRRMRPVGVYCWREDDKARAELSYVGTDGRTVLRSLSEEEAARLAMQQSALQQAASQPTSEGSAQEGEVRRVDIEAIFPGLKLPPPPTFDLGGRLLHFEMSDDPLLMPSLIKQQKSINKTLTMGDRNMNLAGFPERVLKEAQLDGEWVDDPKAPNGRRFIPEMPVFGAATINNFTGIEWTDNSDPENPKRHRTTPSYDRIDPVGSETFDSSVTSGRVRMLDAARQAFALISGDATASGRSREQARAEFEKSLGESLKALNPAGAWVFETAWEMGLETSRRDPRTQVPTERAAFEGIGFSFECLIDRGVLDANERQEDRAQVQAGLMSHERAMVRSGVDDPDNENRKISGERENSRGERVARAEEFEVLKSAGADTKGAAIVAGYTPEEAAQLVPSGVITPTTPIIQTS